MVNSRNYVVYPPEGERPPRTKDELDAAVQRRVVRAAEKEKRLAAMTEATIAEAPVADGASTLAVGGRGGKKSA